MIKALVTSCIVFLFASIFVCAQNIRLILKDSEKKVDVEIDGKLFTSYRWDDRIKRPVLYPVMSAGGSFVTRGFPFETRNDETIDHPHQVGCSFSYGDVNGVDFWNTSTFRTAKELEKMGVIAHQEILSIKNGKGRGELVTRSNWIMPGGKDILFETTKYIFRAKGKIRTIDRETTLTANETDVVFGDSKEGMFAIHVSSELEQSDQIGIKVTSVDGVISERKSTSIPSGEYLNSDGLVGDKVWGTLGKWASVSGRIGNEDVTVALFDLPKNHNFPSYMMVRGYGLLALNPFGRKLFDPSKEERHFTLPSKRSIKFRHRLVIMSEKAKGETIEKEYKAFIRS
ncbi:MAG TPA: PmoA family protein [Pyrinomonadaceae bacterium]|nr:PmoA family protein [Pyrinomonadaceae bacterium]